MPATIHNEIGEFFLHSGPFQKWARKIGYVEHAWAQPCNISPIVAVLAAFDATPYMLIALYKPDLFDEATERLQRTHRKRRRGRFTFVDWFRAGYQIPVGRFQIAWFNIGAWAQRIGWYMLILDAGAGWLVNWTTAAYKWSGCEVPANWWGNGAIDPVSFFVTQNIDRLVTFRHTGSHNCTVGIGGFASQVPSSSCAFSASVTYGRDPAAPPLSAFQPPGVEMWMDQGRGHEIVPSAEFTDPETGSVTHVGTFRLPLVQSRGWTCGVTEKVRGSPSANPPHYRRTGGSGSASGGGDNGFLDDP